MATKVASLYAEIGADLSGLHRGLGVAKQELSGTARDVATSTGSMSKSFKLLGSVATAALAAFSAQKLISMTVELGELGAESLRAEQAFAAMSGEAGNLEGAITRLQAATGGEVAQAELLQRATRMMTDGLAGSTTEVERLFTAAEGLGDVMGLSTTAAIDALTNALETRTPRALRSLGINADAVTARVARLSKTSRGLSEEQIYLEAVLAEVNTTLHKTVGQIDNSVDAFDVFRASTADLKAEVGEGLLPALNDLLGPLTVLTRFAADSQKAYSAARDGMSGWEKAMVAIVPPVYVLDLAIRDLNNRTGEAASGVETIADSAGIMGRAMANAEPSITSVMRAAEETIKPLQDSGMAAFRAADGYMSAQEAARVAADPLNRLAESAGQVASSFGKLDLDPQALWDMALASGANLETLVQLADSLNIASDAEVQASLSAYSLVEQLADGAISADEYARAGTDLWVELLAIDQAQLAAQASGVQLMRGHKELGEQAVIATGQVEELHTSISEVPGKIEPEVDIVNDEEAMTWLLAARGYIKDISGTHNVTFNFRTTGYAGGVGTSTGMQHGGIATGGLMMVGEAGPELIAPPAGSRVFPHEQSRAMAGGTTWNGDLIVNGGGDAQETTALVLRALQDRGMIARGALR